jgi:hypothetical protein
VELKSIHSTWSESCIKIYVKKKLILKPSPSVVHPNLSIVHHKEVVGDLSGTSEVIEESLTVIFCDNLLCMLHSLSSEFVEIFDWCIENNRFLAFP